MFWYWFFAGPALLLACYSLRGERKRAEYVAARLKEEPGTLPRASVIVPVKGHDEGLRENLAALAALDYPDYELIVTAHSAGDIPPGVLPQRVKVVLAHGEDPNTGEKVQNLTAAVRAARKNSRVLAFADSDGRPAKRWLRALVTALAGDGVGAATGFRWFAPDPPGFWSLLRGVWDAATLGLLTSDDCPFAWGGATAIYKETFFDARVAEAWRGTISDDYALSAAIHNAGLRIAYAPGALVPGTEHTTALGLLSWTRRQMTITRVYSPVLWWVTLVVHIFYCGGMAAGLVALLKGHWLALAPLAGQLLPGMWKGLNRAALARTSLPEWEPWFRRNAWAHAILVPVATWVWLVALLCSAFGNTVNWRGKRYRIKRQATV